MPSRGMAMDIVQLDYQLVLIFALGSFVKRYVSQPHTSNKNVSLSIIVYCLFRHLPS